MIVRAIFPGINVQKYPLSPKRIQKIMVELYKIRSLAPPIKKPGQFGPASKIRLSKDSTRWIDDPTRKQNRAGFVVAYGEQERPIDFNRLELSARCGLYTR